METEGKVAIVTGGAMRLGKAMVQALADRKARLAVHYHASAGPAHDVVRQIVAAGGEAIAIQANLSQPSQAPSIIERATAHFGQVDILVNNAAIFEAGNWDDTTEENWDRHFAINLKSPFFLTQAFAGQVKEGQQAHIVNIADWRGVHPGTDHVAYTLTKAALIAMTQSMALALAPHIQVNAIAPGLILPPPGKGPEYLERNASKIPAQRAGSADEIVKTLLFLLGSDFVTGELIYVTGGEHLMAGKGCGL